MTLSNDLPMIASSDDSTIAASQASGSTGNGRESAVNVRGRHGKCAINRTNQGRSEEEINAGPGGC
jgi:hypothetical protein